MKGNVLKTRARELDLRHRPIYTIGEAARYLGIPVSTLRFWFGGNQYYEPVIDRPDPSDPRISFTNLVEAHILAALRSKHEVNVPAVRRATEFAREEFNIDHILIHPEIQHAAGSLFIERYGELINLSRSGQLAMKKILEKVLKRIEYDDKGPIRVFPIVSENIDGPRIIAIDPRFAFGRPMIVDRGISTTSIAQRFNTGESIRELAEDYDLEDTEVEEALEYEPAA